MSHISFYFRKLILVLVLLPMQACAAPLWYKAEPIEGWVVDKESNQPLEGVIVTANWQLDGGIEGSYPVGQMMVRETVTDKNGRYHFPGWGPKLAPLNGRIRTKGPQLLLFNSGYAYRGVANELTSESLRGELDNPLRSDWNGKTIKLEKFDGDHKEYARQVYDLSSEVWSVIDVARGAKECYWKNVPRMLVALHRMSIFFDGQGVKLEGWRLGQRIKRIEDIRSDQRCGAVQEYFRSYMQ